MMGSSGFIATLNGAVVLMETPPTATLALSHAGGWSPLPSPLDTRFATPAFDCSGELGVGGVFAHVTCTAIYTPIVLISNMLEIVTHPDLTTAGMKLDVELTQAIAGGSFTFAVSVAAGLEVLGGPLSTFALPRLKLEGNLIPLGESSLRLVSSQPWAPLPGPLASLQLPTLQGELRIKADGAIGFDLTHGFIAPIDVIPKLSLSGLRINVSLLEVQLPALGAVLATPPSLSVSAFGLATVGGIDGFSTSLTGTVDVLLQTASLTLQHSGGWAPLPGALAVPFTTPAFECALDLNIGSTHLAIACTVRYVSPIELAPDVLRVVGHPTDASATGASLSVAIAQQTLSSTPSFVLTLEAGLELFSTATNAPPIVGVRGTLDTASVSTLALETNQVWTPLPSLMPALKAPALIGTLIIVGDALQINVTHVDVIAPFAVVPGALELADSEHSRSQTCALL